MNIKDEIKEFFRDKGYDLRNTKGSPEDAEIILKGLCKHDALCALELYRQLGITVLGGDVLCRHGDGTIRYTGDGWYLKSLECENERERFERSISESQRYISQYDPPFMDRDSVLFDIVPEYPYVR